MSAQALWDFLRAPLSPGIPCPRWLPALLAAVPALLALCLLRRRRRLKKQTRSASAARGESSRRLPEGPGIYNLQGLGQREEQQDRFAASALRDRSRQGLSAFVCDGMGGLQDGARIAEQLAAFVREEFPLADFAAAVSDAAQTERLSRHWVSRLQACSRRIHEDYRGQGGSTLVQVYLHRGRLLFWAVGDSDLFLLRDGRLYSVNERHEYLNALYRNAVGTGQDMRDLASDSQAGALSSFIGQSSPDCDYSRRSLPLREGDRLLLCTDGVSDSLSLVQLQELMRKPEQDLVKETEAAIRQAAKKLQDNYTAIFICIRAEAEPSGEAQATADKSVESQLPQEV